MHAHNHAHMHTHTHIHTHTHTYTQHTNTHTHTHAIHHLSQSALNLSQEVVITKRRCRVVEVVHSNLHFLHLLKVIADRERLWKLGVQAVLHIFCATNLEMRKRSHHTLELWEGRPSHWQVALADLRHLCQAVSKLNHSIFRTPYHGACTTVSVFKDFKVLHQIPFSSLFLTDFQGLARPWKGALKTWWLS